MTETWLLTVLISYVLQIFSPEQLNELMTTSDYIVVALPGTPATAKFINAEAIKAMQSHAVFINLGRGTTVDEEALTEGISETSHSTETQAFKPAWTMTNHNN